MKGKANLTTSLSEVTLIARLLRLRAITKLVANFAKVLVGYGRSSVG